MFKLHIFLKNFPKILDINNGYAEFYSDTTNTVSFKK